MWDCYVKELEQFGLTEKESSISCSNQTNLESKVFTGNYLIKSRATQITSNQTSIYNNIIYPKTGKKLPCLGMDLMAFSPKKVIIVFDFQHPTENYDYSDPIVEKMMGQYLDNTKDSIRFFEPGNHFSRYIFVRKCTADQVNDYLDDFKIYVDTYKALLDAHQPTGEDYRVYKDFDDYMRRLDPVEGYLAHKFDKEFAKKYVDEFLFPVQQ